MSATAVPTCELCDELSRDQLCRKCVRRVADWIGEIPELVTDLEMTFSRQSVGAPTPGRKSKGDEKPLPFDDSPKMRTARGHVTLFMEWAEYVARMVHFPVSARRVMPTTPASTRTMRLALAGSDLLLRNLGFLRVSPEAGNLAKAIAGIRSGLLAAIDRPPMRLHAGPCGALNDALVITEANGVVVPRIERVACDAPLFSQAGDLILTCRQCGAKHTARSRRAFKIAAFRDDVLTLDQITEGIEHLYGWTLDRALIRQWRRRRKLIACVSGTVESFRVADVLQLAEAARSKPAGSDAQRAAVRKRVARHRDTKTGHLHAGP